MNLAVLAGSAEVQATGMALLHSLWQGALVAGALRVTLGVVPPAQAPLRYAACCGAFAAMFVAPVVTLGWLLSVASSAASGVATQAPLGAAAGSPVLLALVGVWALGASCMAGRLAFGLLGLRRLLQGAAAVGAAWSERFEVLAQGMGLRRRVRLLVSDRVDAPLTLGWLRPVVLLPLGALGSLPAAYLEALLVHELGHVRRFDYLVNLLQSCVEALLFYHPAVYWVSRCLCVEREYCCDDLTVAWTGDARGYARALAAMETWRANVPEPALGALGGSLVDRIERIVRGPGKRGSAPGSVTAAGVLACALTWTAIGLGACGAEQPQQPAVEAVTAEPGSTALAVKWLPPEVARWEPLLLDAAHRNGVDPALLAIVTLVESRGNPEALSPRGAVGLMQIMPATAAQIAAQRGLQEHTVERLKDPAYNLDLGAWYLARQLTAFYQPELDQSVSMAAVAYNAGPKLARANLEKGAALWEETQRYRDLVSSLWKERGEPHSPALAAWLRQLGATPATTP